MLVVMVVVMVGWIDGLMESESLGFRVIVMIVVVGFWD